MRRTRLFMLVALLALCAATTAAQDQSSEGRLAAAEAKWSANKPKAYEFTFRLIACCVNRLSGPGAEPIVFRVENGVGSLTGILAERPEFHAPPNVCAIPHDIFGSDNLSGMAVLIHTGWSKHWRSCEGSLGMATKNTVARFTRRRSHVLNRGGLGIHSPADLL